MPRKKRAELEEDSFLDEEIADDDDEETPVGDEQDEDSGDSGDSDEVAAEEKPAEEEAVEEEEEIDYPPDDKKAVSALQKLGVRLDVSEKGNVWRVIFDDTNGKDPAMLLLNGLPALKELWLLGTSVTAEAATQYKEDHPKVTVYH